MRAVRYATSRDGTSLAWCSHGTGPDLVKVANWLTHLDYDERSPVWSHWIEFFESHFRMTRSDERGCGLSDRRVQNLTIDNWTDDIVAVVDAAEVGAPFYVLGVSQGAAAAITYAVRHPEKVKGLILYGGYARGSNHRDPENAELYRTVVDVFRLGWSQDNPAFQEVFTSRFVPDARPEQRIWFSELCQKTLSAETGADLLLARADVNVEDLLPMVQVPTLVIHVDGDQVVPLEEGRLLATRIPGAQMKVLEGRNHILQEDEPGWAQFRELVLAFTLQGQPPQLADLTEREYEVLREICAAKNNKDIARSLGVSEKTVRNHASNLFAKLEIDGRQQAIRDFGHLF